MADSRLNSIHLDSSRKHLFRIAREALLNARGNQTQAIERGLASAFLSEGNNTAVHLGENSPAAGLKHLLMDQDYVYPLKVGLNTIGRMPDNDVVLPDPYVSRRHCAILVHAGSRCEVHDVASKNGTCINGQKIDGPTALNSGDEITMCGKHLIFITKHEGEDMPAYCSTRA
jgi:FHA domain